VTVKARFSLRNWLDKVFYYFFLAVFSLHASIGRRETPNEIAAMVRALMQSAGQTETLGPATTWYDDYDPYDPDYQGA
jgi:hypothetical protein